MTKAVIDEIRSKALSYIESEKEPYFRNQVKDLLDKEDWDALYDAFYTALAFGTAGMRGVIGGGTNRINTFMVSKVTQGLAEYCNAHVDNPTVVIAYDSRHWSKEFATCASLCHHRKPQSVQVQRLQGVLVRWRSGDAAS